MLAQAIHVRIQALAPADSGPPGAYRVLDSEVVVSGQQTFSRRIAPPYGASALEPLVSVEPASDATTTLMIAGLQAQAVAEHRACLALIDADEQLHLHLDAEAQADLAAALADGAYEGRLASGPGPGPTLVLSHSIALTVTEMNVFRPHVVLAAQLDDAAGHVLWRGTYSASTGGEHHLAGADGWLEHDGAALNASLSASLAAVLRVVLADVAHPCPREPAQLKTARIHVPYELARYDVAAYALVDDGRFVALTPRNVDQAVLGGVILVDKGEVELRAGSQRDRTERVEADVHKLESRTRAGKRARRRAESRIVIESRFGSSKTPVPPTPLEPEDPVEPAAAAPPPPAASAIGHLTATELLERLPARESTDRRLIVALPAPVQSSSGSGAPAVPAPAALQAAVAPAPPVDVARLTNRSWRFAHPRDPGRYGDVRLVFHGARLVASNAVSSSGGAWAAASDRLCVKFDKRGWNDTCYRVVDAGGGDLEVVSVTGNHLALAFD